MIIFNEILQRTVPSDSFSSSDFYGHPNSTQLYSENNVDGASHNKRKQEIFYLFGLSYFEEPTQKSVAINFCRKYIITWYLLAHVSNLWSALVAAPLTPKRQRITPHSIIVNSFIYATIKKWTAYSIHTHSYPLLHFMQHWRGFCIFRQWQRPTIEKWPHPLVYNLFISITSYLYDGILCVLLCGHFIYIVCWRRSRVLWPQTSVDVGSLWAPHH